MEIIDFATRPSLVSQYLTEMRSTETHHDRLRFRRNLERIGEIMAYEMSKTFRYKEVEVTTPLSPAKCQVMDEKIVLATIFRAGVPFHQGFLRYFDNAENAFVSAYRKYKDNDHFDVCIEYLASPSIEGKTLILCDPMLATGSSMELSLKALFTRGMPAKIHIASVIASQQAVDYLAGILPKDITTMWMGVIDPEINEHKYIVPGLGDAGDLAYGEKL